MYLFYFMVLGTVHCWTVDGYDGSEGAFVIICKMAFEFSGYSHNYQIHAV